MDLWIELGLPDERRLRKPAPRPQKWRCLPMIVGRRQIWWQQKSERM
ncbi:YaeQ family protein [Escherichia coli]